MSVTNRLSKSLRFHSCLFIQNVALLSFFFFNLSLRANPIVSDEQLIKVMGMDIKTLLSVSVTTAAKSEQTIDRAPSIISVFTRNDLDKMGVSSLIDIIKYAPGIEVSMATDGHWRVDIRGIRKDGSILLLVDEQPLNDFYDGRAIFDLPVNMIEKVEIIRGPGSALYGTNAVAGVISVTTRQRARSFYLGGDNHHGYQWGFMDRRTDEHQSFAYNVGIVASDGANQTEGADYQPPKLGQTERTNRHLKDIFLAGFYDKQDFKFKLVGLARKRGAYVGPLFEFGNLSEYKQRRFLFDASYKHRVSEKFSLTPRIHLNTSKVDTLNEDVAVGNIRMNNIFTEGGFTKESYSTFGLETELSMDYQINQQFGLLAGANYLKQEMSDYELLRNYQVIGMVPQEIFANHDQVQFEQENQKREVKALYLQTEADLGRWSLTLGVRGDDYSDFGQSVNPRLGVIYHPSEQLKFKWLSASAFRAPTFKELYDNTRIGEDGVVGNGELAAEEIITQELGFEYQADWYLIRGNLFVNQNDNTIEHYDPQGGGAIGSFENTGVIKTKGGAIESVLQLTDSIQLFANLARYRAKFYWNDDDAFELDRDYLLQQGQNELFNAPRTRGKVGLDWSADKWSIFIAAIYGGKASHNNFTLLQSVRDLMIDDYWQFDMSIRYQMTPRLRLKFAANNLGQEKNSDPDYSTNSDKLGLGGLLQPDKTYLLFASYQF